MSTVDATFDDNLKATVALPLIGGQTYDIVFLAIPDNDVYSFDTTGKTVSIDYSKMNSRKDGEGTYSDDDCFYHLVKGYTAGSSTSENVTLHRTVAQINFGTSHRGSIPTGIFAQVSFNAYTSFNVLTGEVAGSAQLVNLPITTCAFNETFPVKPETYSYLAMGYALVPSDGFVSDLKLGLFMSEDATAAEIEIDIPNAPLKRNYRTNIYGSLMEESSDWDISINNNWGGSYDITDYTSDGALANGGNVSVKTAVEEITIPDELISPLTLSIDAPVGTVKIGATSQPVTLKVAKDVAYPSIAFEAGSNVKGLTISGDPDSSEALSGFDFLSNSGVARPAMLEDLTIEGVVFRGIGFEPQYSVSTKNTVIRNCRFLEMKDAAVAIQHAQGGGDEYAENLTIENCVIEIADDASENSNALYILDVTGDVVIRNNTISNAHYHGAFIAGLKGRTVTNVTFTGNTVANAKKDGVKVENVTGTISVSDNTIASKENGIRLKNSVGTADVTVTGNTIDMANTIEWDGDSEPSAILLVNAAENAGAMVTVANNKLKDSNGHDFTVKNVIFASGSNTENPFAN